MSPLTEAAESAAKQGLPPHRSNVSARCKSSDQRDLMDPMSDQFMERFMNWAPPHIDSETGMNCRPGCAACCIAPSITSPIPGMPGGKPAGVPCIQLDESLGCRLFGRAERPAVCSGLQPSAEMCGQTREEAIHWITRLECLTTPGAPG